MEKSNDVNTEIENLKVEINDLEKFYTGFVSQIEERERRWKGYEKKLDEIAKISQDQCILNIGGKNYTLSLHTLKIRRNTIFFKKIQRQEIKKNFVTFFDRDDTFFAYILDYLRTGKFKSDDMSDELKDDILNEAQYYEVAFIVETLKATPSAVEYSHFDFSGEYNYAGTAMGTNKVKDLKDTSLLKGICANSPGWISVAFNREVVFDEIKIGGYNGNSTGWYVGNGKGAKIQASMDGINYTDIGVIPQEFGHLLQNIQVTQSKAKHIKFVHTDLLGIGFLEIKEKKIKGNK